jgi:transcriptional regulator with XRE-family HTH domain
VEIDKQGKSVELKTARDLRIAIATLGCRVTDVARLAGISQPYLSQIMHQKRALNPILRIRVERAISDAAKQVPHDAERPDGLVRLPVPAPKPIPRIRRI